MLKKLGYKVTVRRRGCGGSSSSRSRSNRRRHAGPPQRHRPQARAARARSGDKLLFATGFASPACGARQARGIGRASHHKTWNRRGELARTLPRSTGQFIKTGKPECICLLDDEERIASFIVAVAEGIGWTAEAALDDGLSASGKAHHARSHHAGSAAPALADGVEQLLHREDYEGERGSREPLRPARQPPIRSGLLSRASCKSPRAPPERCGRSCATWRAACPAGCPRRPRDDPANVGRTPARWNSSACSRSSPRARATSSSSRPDQVADPEFDGLATPNASNHSAELDDGVIDELTMW